ncbi:type 1 periplasmic-binding domain-containing protein [Actinophytocola sediminis]
MFDGFKDFIDLLQDLVNRPRSGETPPNRRRRRAERRWGLPLLCVVRGENEQGALAEIREYLRDAQPRPIPHAIYEFPADRETESAAAPEMSSKPVEWADLDRVSAALFEVAKQLSTGGHGKYGPVRFRRFELVHWLMKLRLDNERVDSADELATHIQHFERSRRRRTSPQEGVGQVLTETAPWWVRIGLLVVPPLWFGLRLRVGAKYRWFLRQSFLAPHDPGTFLGFAVRLTGRLDDKQGRRETGESIEELLGLLVNSFLEDVRRAYRRRLRPRGARRTGYPVILLDRITRRNGGYRLLETVNRVRNETGLFDPLLFVSASRRVPPDAFPDGAAPRAVWNMSHARAAYGQWRDEFWRASRARETAAWYLPIRCLQGDDGPAVHPPTDTLEVRPPPLWSRTGVLPTAIALVVALAAGSWLWVDNRLDKADEARETAYRAQHCGLAMTDPRADYVSTIGDECIGASADPIFPRSEELRKVQQVIAGQNGEAERLRRGGSKRQFVSVAYVSEISTSATIVSSEIERQQGIAAQQRRLLDNSSGPLVRIVFVNAGEKMLHGTTAVSMLKKMMSKDRTIVAAVGLAVSSEATRQTIGALGRLGVPTVAASLTADGIEDSSPMYHQVTPQNRREAQVAAKYANKMLGVTGTVFVVSSGIETDLYDSTLASAAVEEFRLEKFTVERRNYAADGGPRAVGKKLCELAGTDGLIFFTGRPADFSQLLGGINTGCGSLPPKIMGGDDVSRYVADKSSLEEYPQLSFDYLALAPGGKECVSNTDLKMRLEDLFPKSCKSNYLTDDAPIAYDALYVITEAVRELHGTAINIGSVWHKLTGLTGDSTVDGASGKIDFGPDGSQIPVDKFVAVMREKSGKNPVSMATCGTAGDLKQEHWCP